MNQSKQSLLSAKMLVCNYTVKNLLSQIEEIETDIQTPINEKIQKMKKIRDEIMKVGMEIDNIKKEITLLNTCNLN